MDRDLKDARTLSEQLGWGKHTNEIAFVSYGDRLNIMAAVSVSESFVLIVTMENSSNRATGAQIASGNHVCIRIPLSDIIDIDFSPKFNPMISRAMKKLIKINLKGTVKECYIGCQDNPSLAKYIYSSWISMKCRHSACLDALSCSSNRALAKEYLSDTLLCLLGTDDLCELQSILDDFSTECIVDLELKDAAVVSREFFLVLQNLIHKILDQPSVNVASKSTWFVLQSTDKSSTTRASRAAVLTDKASQKTIQLIVIQRLLVIQAALKALMALVFSSEVIEKRFSLAQGMKPLEMGSWLPILIPCLYEKVSQSAGYDENWDSQENDVPESGNVFSSNSSLAAANKLISSLDMGSSRVQSSQNNYFVHGNQSSSLRGVSATPKSSRPSSPRGALPTPNQSWYRHSPVPMKGPGGSDAFAIGSTVRRPSKPNAHESRNYYHNKLAEVRQSTLDLQMVVCVEFTKILDLGHPPVHSAVYSMLSPKPLRGSAAKKASLTSNRNAPERLGSYIDGEGGRSFFRAPMGEWYTKQPNWEDSLERYVIRISSLLDDMLASDEVISIMSKSTKTPQTSNLRSTLGSTLGSSVQSAFGSMNDMKDKGTLRSLPSGPTMTTPILKKGLSASLPSNTHVKFGHLSVVVDAEKEKAAVVDADKSTAEMPRSSSYSSLDDTEFNSIFCGSDEEEQLHVVQQRSPSPFEPYVYFHHPSCCASPKPKSSKKHQTAYLSDSIDLNKSPINFRKPARGSVVAASRDHRSMSIDSQDRDGGHGFSRTQSDLTLNLIHDAKVKSYAKQFSISRSSLETQEILLYYATSFVFHLAQESFKIREMLSKELSNYFQGIMQVMNLLCPRPKASSARTAEAVDKPNQPNHGRAPLPPAAVPPSGLIGGLMNQFRRKSKPDESKQDEDKSVTVEKNETPVTMNANTTKRRNRLSVIDYGPPQFGMSRATWTLVVLARRTVESIVLLLGLENMIPFETERSSLRETMGLRDPVKETLPKSTHKAAHSNIQKRLFKHENATETARDNEEEVSKFDDEVMNTGNVTRTFLPLRGRLTSKTGGFGIADSNERLDTADTTDSVHTGAKDKRSRVGLPKRCESPVHIHH